VVEEAILSSDTQGKREPGNPKEETRNGSQVLLFPSWVSVERMVRELEWSFEAMKAEVEAVGAGTSSRASDRKSLKLLPDPASPASTRDTS
jgi:hypothetical protein